jgi:hypothetical protein
MAAALLPAIIALAPPALAVDDPSRPDAEVTHAPSCQPGGLVVEVTAGTAPYSVRLATTRVPEGEDEALLDPGETVVLETGDVDWGETIDGRLEYAALDGSGVTYVDELDDYSFTRPTEEDCAAITPPSAAGTPAPQPVAPAPAEPTPASSEAGEAPAPAPAGDAGLPVEDGAEGPVAPVDDEAVVEDGAQPDSAPVVATAEAPLGARVAPASQIRAVTSWPVFFAGLALLGSTAGLVIIGVQRLGAARRPFGGG